MMKSTHELAVNLVTELHKPHSTDTTKPSEGLSSKVMIRLWGRLLALYGRQWEASYGHVNGNVFKEWQKALSGLSTSQIKIGLDALVQEGW